MWQRLRSNSALLLALSILLSAPAHSAEGGFSGGVTPSRFELMSKPGNVVRKSVKIYNLGLRPAEYIVRTADWSYSPEGQISFYDELANDSCREWVALERHKISVVPDPQRPRNFRFEITVPENAPAQECRFALMLEGSESGYETRFGDGSVTMPIGGRIAVIVYLGIGDVQPEIAVGQLSARTVNKKVLPVVEVRNTGPAHGRLDADLVAQTGNGKPVPLSIATSPIMPGQTRHLALTPDPGYELSYPLTVKGKIYSDAQSISIDQTVDPPEPGFIARQ